MTDTVTPAPGWIPVASQRGLSVLDLPAEPATTPGLAVTPAWRGSTWTGRYAIVHTASGMTIPYTDLPLVYAREVADLLGQHGIDWTTPADNLFADRRTFARVVIAVTGEARDAWRSGIPVRWARSSWQPCPPLWRLAGYDDHWAEDSGATALDHGPAWTTWRGLVGWLDLITTIAVDADDLPPETATAVRDTTLSWRLVCAAPGCHQGRPAVAGWVTGDGDWSERPTTDPEYLADAARSFGWRQHGRHWLCPACAYDHTPNYDTEWW